MRIAPVVALLTPAALGSSYYCAAEWLVRHHSVYYTLHDAGFGFVCNAAEMACFAGPVGSVCVALALAVPSILASFLRVGSTLKALALNAAAALFFVFAVGCMGFLGPIFLVLAALLWISAVLWMGLQYGKTVQLAAAPNGGPAARLENREAEEGPPSVS